MNTDTAITMLLAMGVAAVVSFLATPMVKNLAYKVGAIDVPKDNRRMHKVPIPRLGGLAIFLAFLLSVLVFAKIDRQMQGILLGATMIVVLGVMDDIMALNALPKLIVQILAAGIAVYHGCVYVMDNPEVFMRKFKRAVTDCATAVRHDRENKPGVSNLLTICRAAIGKTMAEADAEVAGQG